MSLFLHVHLNGEPFEEMCTGAIERVAAHHLLKQASQPLPGFERYMAGREERDNATERDVRYWPKADMG